MALPTDTSNSYPRVALAVSFPDDGSLSNALDLGGYRPIAIAMDTVWDAAAISFQALSPIDGATYEDVTNDAGTELSITAAAGKYIWLSSDTQLALLGIRHLKVRSGVSGAPVSQTTGAGRALSLICAPA